MDDLFSGVRISTAGLHAQGVRMRTISENLANADSLARSPGTLPYRRKVVTFKNVLDREMGANTVRVNRVTTDQADFGKRFDPTHPAADRDGYVLTPNVNPLVELMDMREAQRSYEANLTAINNTKAIIQRTVELLR
ncbi:MAG: flagellar basal body rod protein FlgC [Alphaproteobacteria bacterium]|nr:flagellar basal body rod protein FlgC [Alphaproteobacteria bacterium]